MSLSKNISTYTDIHQILVAADKAKPAIYKAKTPGAANHFRQRANNYRRLLADQHNITPFDHLIFRKSESDPCATIIEEIAPEGVLETASGESVPIEKTVPADIIPKEGLTTATGESEPVNEAEAAAKALAAKLRSGDLF
jgi:hypothetical protein